MVDYTPSQLNWARTVVAVGRRLGISERGLIIGLSTTLVESRLRMLANRNDPETLNFPNEGIGKDGRSSGLFQQQPKFVGDTSWWGTVADRMDAVKSSEMFFGTLKKLDYNNLNRSPGKYAQDVQRSAYPDRYDEHMAEATALYKLLGSPSPEVKPPEGIHTVGDPVWLTQVLRDAGLTCDEFTGAYNRGHGDFGKIWGVVGHHTGAKGVSGPGSIANHPTLGLASQLYLDRNGKFTLCGVGIAWHAGEGSWPGITKNAANNVTIGIEADNSGSEGWSDAQYDAYCRGVAAILRKLGEGSDHLIGHKEWGAIQGKWDPGGINMDAMRRIVQDILTPKLTPIIVNEINETAKRNPWIGTRITAEEVSIGSDGKGRMAVFEHAHIYFYPDVGAFAIPHDGLFEAYGDYQYERGSLGYPVREFTPLDGATGKGAVQAFQGGVLYRKDGAGGGYFVGGAIGIRWANEGYELGPMGWPVSNEFTDSAGNRVQLFEGGSMYWHSTGVVELKKG